MSGKFTVGPGLVPIRKASPGPDQLVFQIDDQYEQYIDNKVQCRQENIQKYFLQHRFTKETEARVNDYIISQLLREHPQHFSRPAGEKDTLVNQLTGERLSWLEDGITINSGRYESLFDALCSQVQEDLAVVQFDGDPAQDYVTALHLCAASHWSPADKIGKPFDAVHSPVPYVERITRNYSKMLVTIVTSGGPYTRFGWSLGTDNQLNHHNEAPPGIDEAVWQGRRLTREDQPIYVRTERQNLIGLADVNAFIFTIRTFFYDIATLSREEAVALTQALDSMTKEMLEYKGITHLLDVVKLRVES